MRYFASAIGIIALEFLGKHSTFKVHSKFKKGFNIIADDDLIFIGTNENGDVPFGILVSEATRDGILERISVGDTMHVASQRLMFNADSLNFEAPVKDFIVNYHYSPEQLIHSMEHLSFQSYETGDFNQAAITELISSLMQQTDDAQMLKYFIGRGSGLTPTGDDILVGMLFAHEVQPFISEMQLQVIERLVAQKLTTRVSEAFIKQALQHRFNTRLTDLLNHSDDKAVERLVSVGSSSGMDTAYGIYSSLTRRNA